MLAPGAKSGRQQPFIVMYHGTLVERNGLDVAVAAFEHIRAKLPTAQLHIYGKATPFLERTMQLTRERGLQQSVLHFGEKPLEQIVEAIDACNVGVIPNRHNAFTDINMPTRIFEYLARGKPVIAPRTAGIQDYFDKPRFCSSSRVTRRILRKQFNLLPATPKRLTQSLNEASKSTKPTPGDRRVIILRALLKSFWREATTRSGRHGCRQGIIANSSPHPTIFLSTN